MPTQTVTFTPANSLSESSSMLHIRSLLPSNVVSFLDQELSAGNITRLVEENNGTFTVTNTFTDAAALEYKTLMNGVSENIKTSLANDGWTISFSPETADL